MLTKIIALTIFQLLTFPALASDQTIAKKQSVAQAATVEKLKAHVPVRELQKIIMDYLDVYVPTKLDEVHEIEAAAQSQNGQYLIIVSSIARRGYSREDIAKIWKFKNGEYVLMHHILLPHTRRVAISDDGNYIAFQSTKNSIHLGKLEGNMYIEKSVIEKFDNKYRYWLASLHFFGIHNFLGFTLYGHQTTILQPSDNKVLQRFGSKSSINAAISANGEYIVTDKDHQIQLWRKNRDEFILINELDTGSHILVIEISRDNKYVATRNMQNQINIYSLKNNTLALMQKITFDPKKSTGLQAIKFSPDGTLIAIAEQLCDNNVWVNKQRIITISKFNQNSKKYEPMATLPHENCERDPYILIGFAPDNSVITATKNNEIIIWENQKEQLVRDTGEKKKLLQNMKKLPK